MRPFRLALALLILGPLAGCSPKPSMDSMHDMTSGADALVGSLTDQLGVTPDQAIGGAGSMFSYAKEQLPAADFAQIADAVPGMDGLISQAAGLTGLTGPIGNLGGLTSQFGKLGLSPDMVGSFGNVATDYLTKQGGANVGSLLSGIL